LYLIEFDLKMLSSKELFGKLWLEKSLLEMN